MIQVIDRYGNVYGNGPIIITTKEGKTKGPISGSPGSTTVVTGTVFTPSATDYYIYVNSIFPVTINLPAIANSNPRGYNIKNIGRNTVKIVPLSPELIDDQAEINIKNAYTSLELVHETMTNWYIV
jgi:hypothetical protein